MIPSSLIFIVEVMTMANIGIFHPPCLKRFLVYGLLLAGVISKEESSKKRGNQSPAIYKHLNR